MKKYINLSKKISEQLEQAAAQVKAVNLKQKKPIKITPSNKNVVGFDVKETLKEPLREQPKTSHNVSAVQEEVKLDLDKTAIKRAETSLEIAIPDKVTETAEPKSPINRRNSITDQSPKHVSDIQSVKNLSAAGSR